MRKNSQGNTLVCHHHHHHVVPLAWISLTLSHHFSLSFIASGRSSELHPVSSHSCCMYVRAGRPAFARPYVGVHRSTSLMSSSLLLQQCPACLVRLTWIVFVMRGRCPYSWCLVGVAARTYSILLANLFVDSSKVFDFILWKDWRNTNKNRTSNQLFYKRNCCVYTDF